MPSVASDNLVVSPLRADLGGARNPAADEADAAAFELLLKASVVAPPPSRAAEASPQPRRAEKRDDVPPPANDRRDTAPAQPSKAAKPKPQDRETAADNTDAPTAKAAEPSQSTDADGTAPADRPAPAGKKEDSDAAAAEAPAGEAGGETEAEAETADPVLALVMPASAAQPPAGQALLVLAAEAALTDAAAGAETAPAAQPAAPQPGVAAVQAQPQVQVQAGAADAEAQPALGALALAAAPSIVPAAAKNAGGTQTTDESAAPAAPGEDDAADTLLQAFDPETARRPEAKTQGEAVLARPQPAPVAEIKPDATLPSANASTPTAMPAAGPGAGALPTHGLDALQSPALSAFTHHLNAATTTSGKAAAVAGRAATVTADPAVPLAGLAVEIAARAQNGKNRFDIRLDPAELGRIEVRLEVDKDGNVTSRLTVDKVETYDLLRRDSANLERALQNAGLKTSEGGLEFSLRDQNAAGREQNGRQEQSSARIVLPDEDAVGSERARRYGHLLGLGSGVDIKV